MLGFWLANDPGSYTRQSGLETFGLVGHDMQFCWHGVMEVLVQFFLTFFPLSPIYPRWCSCTTVSPCWCCFSMFDMWLMNFETVLLHTLINCCFWHAVVLVARWDRLLIVIPPKMLFWCSYFKDKVLFQVKCLWFCLAVRQCDVAAQAYGLSRICNGVSPPSPWLPFIP